MSAPIKFTVMHTVETQTQTGNAISSPSQAITPYPAPRHQAISAAAGSNPVTAEANGSQKVLAERYKTKICKKFLELGVCPYESRCMFAHGEEELRTAEMNLHDGIVTEDAIRHFKRLQSYKKQPGSTSSQNRPPSYDVTASSFSDEYSEYYAQSVSQCNERRSSNVHSSSSPLSRTTSGPLCMNFTSNGSAFSYDPYAWTPFHNAANPDCECADCWFSSAEYTTQTECNHDEEFDYPASKQMNNKLPMANSQSDLVGHALHRPTMP